MPPSQKRPLIPPNPLVDGYDLLGIPFVYVGMLASLWLLTDIPVTVISALWSAGLVVCGCVLLLGYAACTGSLDAGGDSKPRAT